MVSETQNSIGKKQALLIKIIEFRIIQTSRCNLSHQDFIADYFDDK